MRQRSTGNGHVEKIGHWLSSNELFIAIALLALLPALIVAGYILAFGVNVVNYDQWEFVPLLDKLYGGTLTPGDVFAQHNEHRIVFPKLIMLGLAYLTHYNTVAEMGFSWLATLGTFALIFDLYRRRASLSARSLLLFLPVAWLFFSLRQFDNILWGWQLQVYLSILGVVGSIYLLDRVEKLDAWFAGAIGCSIIASFSFVNGLLVWPIGLLLIVLSKPGARLKLAAAYAAAGVLVFIAFFYGWAYPSGQASILSLPVASAAQFLLINIGSPLAFEKGYALAAGMILVCLMAVLGWFLFKDKMVARNAPWIALIAFSLLSSGAITFGRTRLGLDEALASRYTSFTLLLVISAYMIAATLLEGKKNGSDLRPIIYGMVLSLALLGIVTGLIGGLHFGPTTHSTEAGWAVTLAGYDDSAGSDLSTIYPHVDKVKEGIHILKKWGLNVFSGP